jgi:hypothetical protein
MAKKKVQTMFRQGDVLIVRTDEDIAGKEELPRNGGRIILAEGEVTGHAHAIVNPKVRAYQGKEGMLLAVNAIQAMLQHEEHASIALPKGTYKVVRQREFTSEMIRMVAD